MTPKGRAGDFRPGVTSGRATFQMEYLMDYETRLQRLENQLARVERYASRSFWQALDKAYEKILPNLELNCIICSFSGYRDKYKVMSSQCQFGGGRLERYQCPKCEAIFGPQKYLDLDDEIVDLDYQILYSRYKESDSTNSEFKTFRSLSPQKNELFLNWGCGEWCQTIPRLRDDGFDVWGFEPSLAQSDGYIVKSRSEISAKFDGIFSNNVIEHFRDPIGQFREFRNLLKPGGRMAHSSPCYNYSYDFTRFHTLFLLGKSPYVLAERTGFVAEKVVEEGEYINVLFRVAG